MIADDDVENIEVRLLLEAIHARYGYDLRQYSWASLKRRVLAALAKSGLRSLSEFQHSLLRDPALFAEVLENLTVRMTDMFRDPQFYETLRQRVVPLLRTYPLLNVWHAGCATGEEVYATAILLSEEGLYERAQIYGTDLSARALEQARQRLYPASRVHGYAANHARSGGTPPFSSYYTAAYDHVAFRESLGRNIVFFQHDLVGDYVFGEMQLIFCRNVLIYFRQDLRERVVDKLARSLCPGGFLCLGNSERLPLDRHGVFQEFAAADRIYRHAD
jgi:chemotaxis protein methyltransferase CheR